MLQNLTTEFLQKLAELGFNIDVNLKQDGDKIVGTIKIDNLPR